MTFVETIDTGRQAISVEQKPLWAKLARANIKHAVTKANPSIMQVIEGDARDSNPDCSPH